MDNERHIIAQLKKGQTAALEALMNRYADYVYTILKSMLTKEEAEEASQDSFLKVYRHIHSYRDESKFTTWLYSIAYRTGLDYIKKRKNHQPLNGLSNNHNFSRTVIDQKDLNEWINLQLKKIKAEDAALVKLYYLQELNVQEVAEITGLTESNVKVKLFRIRNMLKKQMANLKLEDILN